MIRWMPSLRLLVPLLLSCAAQAADLSAIRDHLDHARYEDAIEQSEALIAAGSEQAEALALLGEARAATGATAAAHAAWTRAAALPGSAALVARVALARQMLAAGQQPAARAALHALLSDASSASDAVALGARAEAARLLGRFDPGLFRDAVRFYQQAIEAAPEAVAPRVALAGLLLDKYNNTEASALIKQTLELHPEHPHGLLVLARSLRFDHSDEVEQVLERTLAVAPGLVEALVLAARVKLDVGDLEEAERLVGLALAVNPESLPALGVQAALAFLRDDPLTREAAVQRALSLAPGDAGVWNTLSEVAAQQRRYAEAFGFARYAVQVDASDWHAHGLLGSNRVRMGAMKRGRIDLERAFRGDPFNAWFKNTLDLLDELDGYAEVGSERFRVFASGAESAAMAPLLLPLAEQAYQRFAERYQHEPTTPLRVEVYPEQRHLSVRTLGLVGVDLLGVSFGPVVAMDSPSARPDGFNWGSVLWHELAHSFHLQLTGHRVPRWFSEGLAVHEEHLARSGWGSDVDVGFLIAWRDGELRPASELDQAFLHPRSMTELQHAYVQGGLVLAMFEELVGIEGIRLMLHGYRDGVANAEVLRSVLGLTPSEIDRRFAEWLEARYSRVLAAIAETPAEGDPESPGGRYVEVLQTGWKALEEDDTERAESAFLEAWQIFPTHAGAHSPMRGLARLALERGKPAAAADWLRRLVAVDADDLQAHRDLLAVEEQLGDPATLVDLLEATLYLQPFDIALRERLASLYEEAGRWQPAARERAAVAALDPPDPVTAGYLLARAWLRAGAPQRARDPLLRALEAAPLYEPALDLLLEMHETPATADDG